MESRGVKIAGGVIQIVAGTFWLVMSLFINHLAKHIGYNLDTVQIIAPVVVVVLGIMACTTKPKKWDYICFGLLNVAFIAINFYFKSYMGLGLVQMGLLLVSAILFFCVKTTSAEIEYRDGLKLFKSGQPKKTKGIRVAFYILSFLIAVLTNLIIVNYALKKPIVKLPFDLPGFPLLICFGLFFLVCVIFLIVNAKLKTYKITQNIFWNFVALIPTFFLNMMFFSKQEAKVFEVVDALTGTKTVVSTTPATCNGIELAVLSFALYIVTIIFTIRAQIKADYDIYKENGNK